MRQEHETDSSPSYDKRRVGVVTTSSTGGGAVAGALTVLVVWVLSMRGIDVPAEVASGFTVILAFIGGIIGGWLVKPGTGSRRA